MVLDLVKPIDLSQFFRGTRRWHIGLIGEDQKDSISEFLVDKHREEFSFRGLDLRIVCTVDDKDDRMRIGIVSVPGRPQVFLTTEVPHLQSQVLMLHLLHV